MWTSENRARYNRDQLRQTPTIFPVPKSMANACADQAAGPRLFLGMISKYSATPSRVTPT